MSDLKVDYELLSSTEKTLSSLVGDFQNIESSTGDYDSALGSPDVQSAMGHFAGNWETHRKQIVSSMQSLGSMVAAAKTHFQNTDAKIAASVTANSK